MAEYTPCSKYHPHPPWGWDQKNADPKTSAHTAWDARGLHMQSHFLKYDLWTKNCNVVIINFTEVGTASKLWWGAELWVWIKSFSSRQIQVRQICRLLDMTGGFTRSCLAKCTSDDVPVYPGQDAKIDFPTDLTSSARTWKSCQLSTTIWLAIKLKESWTERSSTKTSLRKRLQLFSNTAADSRSRFAIAWDWSFHVSIIASSLWECYVIYLYHLEGLGGVGERLGRDWNRSYTWYLYSSWWADLIFWMRTGSTSIKLLNHFACIPCPCLSVGIWSAVQRCCLGFAVLAGDFEGCSFLIGSLPNSHFCWCFWSDWYVPHSASLNLPRSSGTGDARFISVYKNPPAGTKELCALWSTQRVVAGFPLVQDARTRGKTT